MTDSNKFCINGPKIAYKSIRKAKQVRNTLGRGKNVQSLRIYKCPYCHHYHFTHVKD